MFQNLLIDSTNVLLLYIYTIGVIALCMMLAKKRIGFSIRVFTALVLGLIAGFIFQEDATIIRPIGQLYVRLIMMIVIPLVFTSIIKSFTDLKDTKNIKGITLKALFWLMLTTGIGSFLAIVFGVFFDLGSSFDVSSITYTPREIVPFEEVVLNMFPNNIIAHMSNNQMIPIIIFAIFISVAMIIEGKKKPERIAPFKAFIDSFQAVMVRLTKIVIRFTPYGVFALIANAAGRNNMETLRALGLYIIVFYAVMVLHFIVVHLGLITFVGKLNPVRFIKNIYPAQVVGFSSQSSYGTLPITIKSLTNRVGVDEKVASFVAPLGANVGMNACGGMFPALVAIITANAFGIELVLTDYFLIIFTTMIASIGIAGVPGIASIAATVVLVSLGLPLEGIALVIGVDALIDMGRTSLNITGTMVSATLTAKQEGLLDVSVYEQDNVAKEQMI